MNVKLSANVWQISKPGKLTKKRKKLQDKKNIGKHLGSDFIPHDPKSLRDDPALIRRFRADCYWHQPELARALGVKRQTISNYECGKHKLPMDKAIKILQIWHEKTRYQ